MQDKGLVTKKMLERAIRDGDKAWVEQILLDNPSLADGTDEDGLWLVFLAAKLGKFEIVKYFVEYSRASFDTVDADNRDILHYAVISGNVELVKYLVERVGMSPLRGDLSLITPYDIAVGMGHSAIEAYFEQVCGAKLSEMYRNPILTGMHPDPSIVCVGEDFYMVNSSFIYFPCIPISHSRDLIHWEIIGYAITNPQWAGLDDLESGRGYWAPDISYYEGRFYITATYRLNDDGRVYRKQMVTSSEKPEGPYCEPVFFTEDGIDPSLFTDDDGKRYMLLNRGARIFEISADGKEQLGEAKLLYYGHQKKAPEGAHLLKKDGYYYLFQAEGGTGLGHRISVSRSLELFGVYEPCPYNPIMRQQDEKAAIQRCGHGKPVRTPNGQWYMVYLCARQVHGKYSLLGRETALDPIHWTEDGWPIVNMLQGPSALQIKPDLPPWTGENKLQQKGIHPLTGETYEASEGLGYEWMTPRPPEEKGIRQEEEFIVLRGSKKPLSGRYARNILLRRQEHFRFDFQVSLKVPQLGEEQHCGIVAYYDENTYVRYSLLYRERHYWVQLVEHIGKETKVVLEEPIWVQPEEMIQLETNADYLKRRFCLIRGKEVSQEVLNEVILDSVTYLCDEGITMGKRFTAAMVGLYAYAGEEDTLETRFTKPVYIAK